MLKTAIFYRSVSKLLEWATWVYRVCTQAPVYSLHMWQASEGQAYARVISAVES